MFKFNDTAAFVHNIFVAEDHAYVCREACKKNSNHLEMVRKATIVAYKNNQVVQRREKVAAKVQQKTQEETRLAGVKQMKNEEHVILDMTAAQLKDQLDIYRRLVDGVPKKSHLKAKAAMIEALKVAIEKHKGHYMLHMPQS